MTYKRALIPIAVLIVASCLLAYLQRPFTMQLMLTRMPPESAARMSGLVESRLLWFTIAAAGLARLIGVAVSAGATVLTLSALFAKPVFERTFAAAAWATLAFLVRDTVRLVSLMSRGLESIRTPADLVPGIGMGFLVSERSSLAYNVLESLNVYDFAFIWVFAGLLSANGSIRPGTALAGVLIPWVFFEALRIGVRSLVGF